jgi:hypothetical protein
MRTIFVLFSEITSADNATQQLIDAGYTEQEMNAMAQEVAAKQYLNISDQKLKVYKTDHLGKKEINGLPAIFIGHKAIHLSDVGRILACGTIALEIAGLASDKPAGGLKQALQVFDIPELYADNYTSGIIAGGILFILKTNFDKSGEVIRIFDENKGKYVLGVP